jgi:hypothetical protein
LKIGGDQVHDAVIWFGLVQAAHGAAHLGCEYLWLDLLCIDQTSAGDKRLQIKNMGTIYQRAEVVLVMFGGVSAVQGMGSCAYWIDRAWTLQEAILCSKTYGLVRWDYGGSIRILGPNPVDFMKVGQHGIALVAIRELLRYALLLLNQPGKELQGSLDNGSGTRSTEFPFVESAGCVGNSVVSISELWGVLQAQENIRLNQSSSKREDFRRQLYSSTWRSMWLRTSTKPQDMVFSTMHLLNASIEVDYERTQQDLILELSGKVEYPAWWDIGNLIPVDPDSGLLPKLPDFYPNSLPSYLARGTKPVQVATYVSSRHYISDYDIDIIPPVENERHRICARTVEVMGVRNTVLGWKLEVSGDICENKRFDGTSSPVKELKATCLFDGKIYVGDLIIILGNQSEYHVPTLSPPRYGGPLFGLLRETGGVWSKVGNGTITLDAAQAKMGVRIHIGIGGTSQTGLPHRCQCLEVITTQISWLK